MDTTPVSPKKDYLSKTDIVEAEAIFSCFFEILRSFIHESHFDAFRFDTILTKLNQDFVATFTRFEHTIQQSEHLVKQAQFIDQMFDTMVRATDILLKFDNIASPETYLMTKMINLHLNLFTFYVSCGNPETISSNAKTKIHGMWEDLVFWKQTFRTLDASPEIHQIFKDHGEKAEQLIKPFL